MGKKKTTKSSKPTGLKITRNGLKFTCEWTIPKAGYGDGQKFKSTGQSEVSIGKTVKKKVITLSADNYYPTSGKKKLAKFTFHVRGNSDPKSDNKKWSDWADKEFTLNPPRKPSVTAELDDEYANKCKFSWSVADTGADTHYPFKKVKIWSKLLANCTCDPKDADWSGAEYEESTSASSYKTYTENTSEIATGTHTRLFKIVACGIGGDSEPAYSKHVYAAPKQSVQTNGENAKDVDGGHSALVEWNTSYGKDHPIDESIVQWAITKPLADMSCPDDDSIWNTFTTVKDTDGSEAVVVTTSRQLDLDECMYTRINTKHDDITTKGAAVLRKIGKMKTPTNLVVSNVDMDNRTARVAADNASSVPSSKIEVIFRKNGEEKVVGYITGSPAYVDLSNLPAWTAEDTVVFGVRAVSQGREMISDDVWQGGTVAVPPTNVTAVAEDDNVRVSWTNNWEDANNIELSWADDKKAWESTNPPSTFMIESPFAASWLIAGLGKGKTWYVRVRSVQDIGDTKTYSPYSAIAEVNLASSPNVPTLALSKDIIAVGEGFTASWDYSSTDGTLQAQAVIYEVSGGNRTEVGRADAKQHIDLDGWDTAGTKYLCVEVVSGSELSSGYSDVIAITVVPPLDVDDSNMTTSLEAVSDADKGNGYALTEMPLEVTLTGAGTGGRYSVVVTRREAYDIQRPDDDVRHGYKDEVIADIQNEDGLFTIGLDDLIGSLDDGGQYTLTATIQDNVGQFKSLKRDFDVDWARKAIMPSGRVVIDQERMVARIYPIAPTGAIGTDRCDIYRLSADSPELVYENAEFGDSYIDPYPAIGEYGGYRLVFKTVDGGYVTGDGIIAFYDIQDAEGAALLSKYKAIIDFGDEQLFLMYNVDFSNKWKKDFQRKKYLGGSVKGYWKTGVERDTDMASVVIPIIEGDIIEKFRILAEHDGICHIRTYEGSSFACDIQVSDDWKHEKLGKVIEFSMSISRIDNEGFDGMTYDQWLGEQ